MVRRVKWVTYLLIAVYQSQSWVRFGPMYLGQQTAEDLATPAPWSVGGGGLRISLVLVSWPMKN